MHAARTADIARNEPTGFASRPPVARRRSWALRPSSTGLPAVVIFTNQTKNPARGPCDPHGRASESALLRTHQRRIRYRRIGRLRRAKAAIRHSRSEAACRKKHSMLLGPCRQCTRSSDAPVNHGPGANHHNNTAWKTAARIIDNQWKNSGSLLLPEVLKSPGAMAV